jgi:tetratricopeptide (TPR) repeat protein
MRVQALAFGLALLASVEGCASHASRTADQAFAAAERLSLQKHCTEALPLFAEAIEKKSSYTSAYYGLSQCEEILVSYKLAAYIAGKGLSVDPANAALYQLKSDIEFNQGTYQGTLAKAVADEVKSAQFVRKDPAEYVNIAAKLSDMTAYDEAVLMIDKALPLVSDRAPLYSLRGSYYASANKFADAHADFRRAQATARSDMERAQAYAQAAAMYLQEHNLPKAEADILRAMERAPQSYSIAMIAANIYAAKLDSSKAWSAANRAVALATDGTQAGYARKMRGDQAVRLGKRAAALSDYEWILANSPDYVLKTSAAKIVSGLNLQR